MKFKLLLGTIYKTPCLIASLSPSVTNSLVVVILGEFFLTGGDSSPDSQRVLAAQRSRDGSGSSGSSLLCGSPDAVVRFPPAPRLCGLQGVTDTRFGLRCAAPAALSTLGAADVVNSELQVCILCCWLSASHLPQPPLALNTSSVHPAGQILKMTLQSECFGQFLLLFTHLFPHREE